MSTDTSWHDEIVLPALLRHARATYGKAMRRALEAAGFDDIPGNGLYILGGLALEGGGRPIGELVRGLGVSKQAGGQLVDTLVSRGYLARTPDENDRRQLIVTLTDRGRAAAAVQAEARMEIDALVADRVGAEDVARTRRTLAALIDIGHEASAG